MFNKTHVMIIHALPESTSVKVNSDLVLHSHTSGIGYSTHLTRVFFSRGGPLLILCSVSGDIKHIVSCIFNQVLCQSSFL